MRLTEVCIKRPVTTAMFFVALIVLGIFSGARMPMDLFPAISYPAISVFTSYEGAGPEEIEELITIPVEQAVSTVNGVQSITSNSQEGSSRVTVRFSWGTNLDEAANDIRGAVDRVRRRLPDEADPPTVNKFDPSMSPIISLAVSGDVDEVRLREFAEDDLSYQLQRVDGVASVDVRGGRRREIHVYLRQNRLQALGLTADQIVTAIRNENSSSPAGTLAVGVGDYVLRAQGDLKSLDELRNLAVADRNGVPIYLRDIAEVQDGFTDRQSLVRIDGGPGIVISVSKRSGSNTVAVADRIYEVLAEVARQNPGINLRVLSDDSLYIRNALKSVRDAGLLGAALAALILLFFLHNVRATIITGLAMPISVMATLILAYFSKMTLNAISLGGLALGVGMLVDNGIVVLDNIFRHYQRDPGDVAKAALAGTSEMGPALSASTLTTICVFFPLIFVTGRDGIIFKELSYMVIFSILCSLAIALTLLPMLCSRFLKVRDLEGSDEKGLVGALLRTQHRWEDAYEKTLLWCLRHKPVVIAACALIFLATLSFVPFIGSELVQDTDEGIISINLQLPTGTRMEETDLHALALEEKVQELVPELENMEDSVGGNSARLTLRLRSKAERRRSTQEIAEDLQERIQIPGARLRVSARNSMRMLYGGSSSSIAIDIRGYDQQLTRQFAYELEEKLGGIPGIGNTSVSREEERPELSIVVNRKRAADYGVTAAQVANAIRTNIDGRSATVFREAGEETQIRVNLREEDRQSWQDLGRILLSGRNNRLIPLSSVADLVQTNSPVSIERKEQERNITVSAGLSGRDLGSAMADVRRIVDALPRPPGVSVHYSGDYEEQQRSFQDMLIAFVLALLLVYMVMAAQFESFLDPLIIMFTVPLALSGVFTILLFTNTSFNSQVYLGLILLGGVVVNNAIVMISYFRILLADGLSLEQAVLSGARSRLRPIAITTCTTLLALLPLALGLSEGSETQSPLARTVIGGLAFAAVLTLFLIPVIFAGLEGVIARTRERRTQFARRKAGAAGAALALLILSGSTWAAPVRAAESPLRLTLAQAVELALENSEDGRLIRQRRAQIDSEYSAAMAAEDWKLSSTLEATAAEDNGLRFGLGLAKPLAPLAKRIAAQNREIALLAEDQREQDLLQAVAIAFQRELQAARDAQLAEESLERSRRLWEEVRARAEAGLTNISDEIGAEAQVVSAEATLNRARQTLALAQIKLRQLLNLDEDAVLDLAPPAGGEAAAPNLEALLLAGRAKRADLRRAELNLERAKTMLDLAGLAKKQGMTISWNLEREDYRLDLSWSNRTGSGGNSGEWGFAGGLDLIWTEAGSAKQYADYGTIKLTLTWTLFDGGAREERIEQAELELAQAGEERRKAEKDAAYEIREAYYNLLYQQDRLKSGEMQLRYSRSQYEALQAKLGVGLASVKDVLDAQLILQGAEAEYERAKSDLFLAGIALAKASGQLEAGSL